MYNTQFKVKYNDIEEELIHKLKNNTTEHEYTSQDVLDICNKLYRDELATVFSAENITDDIIDKGIKYVSDIMITNTKFKEIIEELNEFCMNEYTKNEEISNEEMESIKHLTLLFLFSQNMFYITHKCICQQIELGLIDDNLLVELKNNSIDLIKN